MGVSLEGNYCAATLFLVSWYSENEFPQLQASSPYSRPSHIMEKSSNESVKSREDRASYSEKTATCLPRRSQVTDAFVKTLIISFTPRYCG